jgi:tetratricopeptide (TPR) repeat protein
MLESGHAQGVGRFWRFDATLAFHYPEAGIPSVVEMQRIPFLTGLLALALSLAGPGGGASAQTAKPPAQKEAPAKPDAEAQTEAPEAADPAQPAPLPKHLSKTPTTAAEKARVLNDLYALLAAADDEAKAKAIASRIERVWAVSGSDTVNLLLERAAKAIQEKRTELALKLLDSAVALAPDFAEAFSRRAYFHFRQNNYEAAVGDLRRVLALDPNHYKALEGLAQVWRETGNKRGAYEVMKQLLDVHPFAPGAKSVHDELKREVDGQGI